MYYSYITVVYGVSKIWFKHRIILFSVITINIIVKKILPRAQICLSYSPRKGSCEICQMFGNKWMLAGFRGVHHRRIFRKLAETENESSNPIAFNCALAQIAECDWPIAFVLFEIRCKCKGFKQVTWRATIYIKFNIKRLLVTVIFLLTVRPPTSATPRVPSRSEAHNTNIVPVLSTNILLMTMHCRLYQKPTLTIFLYYKIVLILGSSVQQKQASNCSNTSELRTAEASLKLF